MTMKKIYLLLISLIALSFSSKAAVCTVSDTQSGSDQSGFTATVTNFGCPAPNTILSATMDASIGANCTMGGGNLYYYDIYVNGALVATAQCDQLGFDLTPYLPLTSVTIQAVDDPADGNLDAVTLDLNVHLTYNIPYPLPSAITCGSGSPSLIFSDDLETGIGWTGDIGTSFGTWRLPNANPGGNSGNTGPNGPHSGTTYAEFEASGAAFGTYSIVSPLVDLTSATDAAELSFWMYAYGTNMGTLNVGVSTSPTGPFTNEYSWFGQHQTSDNQPWANIGVDLSAYLGQAIYLEFSLDHNGTGILGDMAIDLVEVTSCAACPTPSALFASNIQGTSVQLNWTENGSATNWVVEYGPAGFTPGTGTMVGANSNPYTLNGLTAISTYDVYIRSNCIGDSSLYHGPIPVNTLVDDLSCGSGFASVIYHADFENVFPTDWNQTAFANPMWGFNTGGTSTPGTGPNSAALNNGYLYFETSGGVFGDTDTLYAPMIDLSTVISNSRLVFYYHMFGASIGDLEVEASADQSTWTSVFVQSGQVQTSSSDDWIPSNIDLSAFSGAPVWIRIIATRNSSFTGDIGLDNFSVEGCVACPAPTLISVSDSTETSVELSWTAGSTETNWVIEYGAPGFTPGTGTTVNVASNPANVTGLTDNTEYDFYVYANCGGGNISLAAGPVTGSTGIFCIAPQFFGFEYAANDTVSLQWVAGGSETSWNIEWGTTGFTLGSGTNYSTTTIPDSIFGLSAGGVFDFYVQADCGFGVNNPWVGPITYATPATNDLSCDFIPIPVDGSTTVFSNVGATVSPGEPSSGFNTVWFTFVAPPSGYVEINTCGADFNNYLEIFESSDCANFSLYIFIDVALNNPFPSCSDASDAGINVCYFTPGKTYYLAIGSENVSDEGIFPLTITEITQVSAGTAMSVMLCESVTSYSLFSAITGSNTTDGQWYTPTVGAGNGVGAIINPSILSSGVTDFHYVEMNACTSDTVYVPIEVVDYANTGTGQILAQTCNYGDLDLYASLIGAYDLGGTWKDDTSAPIADTVTFNGEAPGTYNFYYVIDNGICPADSTTITAQVIDCASIDENQLVAKIYPNPVLDFMNVELNNVDGTEKIQVFNIQGEMIAVPQYISNSIMQLDMSEIPSGIYVLRVISGLDSQDFKFVKS